MEYISPFAYSGSATKNEIMTRVSRHKLPRRKAKAFTCGSRTIESREAENINTAFLTTHDDWRMRSYPLGVLLMRWSISLPPILLVLTAYVYHFEASFVFT
jgi:hypothetical protein